ncbi:MAG: fibronectin type III domain-containing protein [Betaproteobacteria bacterium]|nr:fibronectin type III domain-containing protein [Betaproteobacteria bacterium]
MLKRLMVWMMAGALGLAFAGNARADFHIFQIVELYSNADGTIQYVEFLGLADGQHVWAGHSMTSTDGVTTNTYNFATNLPNSATLNKSVLVATQGFANLGIVTPDYVIPDGFLFTTGGTVTFPGMDSVVHAALPTNGVLSINRTGVTAVNSPRNFAGVTGTVPSFDLTVSKTGTGSGTVTSSPAGIDCGATCSANFGINTTVTLTATPDAGSTFTGWSGACTGTGGCMVKTDAAKSVTADFTVAAADTQAPTVPTGLNASPVSGSQINLAWTASTDNVGVTAYEVFRGGVFRATVNAPAVSFSDTGLTVSTTYTYTVRACDAAGNCSALSSAASATTQDPPPPDTQPPTVPTGLTAVPASGSQVDLAWTASTDNVGVTQYRIYRDSVLIVTVTGTPPTASHSDTGLTASTLYSYAVAACDALGNCSAQSDAASATTLAAGQSAYYPQLESGFNLIGNALDITIDVPATFGNQDAPVADVTPNIITIWKWSAAEGRWAFYSPQLTAAGNASYAAGIGYAVLSTIAPGEGYWVNAAMQMTLPTQTGTPFNWGGFAFSTLPSGFNLITHATTVTPSQFNIQVTTTPPGIGVVPTDNFVTLWAWDAAAGNWYFHSPLLESSGGLDAVKSFADSQGYRHFPDYGKMLGIGTGFWVNRP